MSKLKKYTETEIEEILDYYDISREDIAVMAKKKSLTENEILNMVNENDDVNIFFNQSELLYYMMNEEKDEEFSTMDLIASFLTTTIKKEDFADKEEMTFGEYLSTSHSDKVVPLSEGQYAYFY